MNVRFYGFNLNLRAARMISLTTMSLIRPADSVVVSTLSVVIIDYDQYDCVLKIEHKT